MEVSSNIAKETSRNPWWQLLLEAHGYWDGQLRTTNVSGDGEATPVMVGGKTSVSMKAFSSKLSVIQATVLCILVLFIHV